eukprot:Clim_evm1s100 gene=Clim_evmTU1s100
MNFKIAALAAGAAVASAGSVETIPEIVRQTIASQSDLFTSEAARQQFLEGEDPVERHTDMFIGKQTNFGKTDCTEADTVKSPAVACAVFRLEGDNKEIIVDKDARIGGTFTIGDQETELNYKLANNKYAWTWNMNGNHALPDDDATFSFQIGKEGETAVLDVTNDWIDPLFVLQLPNDWLFNGQRLFWYRSAGGHVKLDSVDGEDRFLWCGVLAEPKCLA